MFNNRLIIQFGSGISWTLYTLPITYTTCYSIAVGAVGDTRAVGSVIVEQSNLAQFNLFINHQRVHIGQIVVLL